MFRVIAFSYLLVHVSADIDGDTKLQDIYQQSISNDVDFSDLKCSNIVGRGQGCYECYVCNDPQTERLRQRGKIITDLQLFDNNCSKTDLCCFSQAQNTYRESYGNCGINNPEGYPRRVRETLRSVLPGEYPWRAWIYDKENRTTPVCAAIYISENSRALMTSAYCVEPYYAENLIVRFTKGDMASYEYDVKKIYMHKYYNSETRYYDIAVIGITSEYSIQPWFKPVCLSPFKKPFASACVAVSSDDYYLNAIIPQQTKCVDGKIPLDESFLCTVAPRNDYEPEFGGGLFCPEDEPNRDKEIYMAYGITLYKSGDTPITVHTNVTFFYDWIQDRLNDLYKISDSA